MSTKEKRILVIEANGDERVLASAPTLKEMQKIVGGLIEHVKVLDRIENGRFIYTSMFVSDTGLIDGLPRNQKATEVYQRNVRAAYPNSTNPFREAHEKWKASLPTNVTVIDGRPEEAKSDEYRNSPWICGPAILFDGYTCEEADEAFCASKVGAP
jgi:hypothetical protein